MDRQFEQLTLSLPLKDLLIGAPSEKLLPLNNRPTKKEILSLMEGDLPEIEFLCSKNGRWYAVKGRSEDEIILPGQNIGLAKEICDINPIFSGHTHPPKPEQKPPMVSNDHLKRLLRLPSIIDFCNLTPLSEATEVWTPFERVFYIPHREQTDLIEARAMSERLIAEAPNHMREDANGMLNEDDISFAEDEYNRNGFIYHSTDWQDTSEDFLDITNQSHNGEYEYKGSRAKIKDGRAWIIEGNGEIEIWYPYVIIAEGEKIL